MTPLLGTNLVTQVAIIVKDIEVTKKKFAAFFGVEPPATITGGDFEITGTTYMGQPAPKAGAKLAFFNVGNNMSLELIEPNGEQSTWQDFLDEKGEGLHHIAFGIKDTDGKIAACEQFGMTLTQRGKYGDASGEYAYLDATKDLKCFIELLESY
ncbi:MAG: VOC family protein [Defluviitaleaceae bacterium]|nr:VOC family protein [Defluviitaleaceae bacterium]